MQKYSPNEGQGSIATSGQTRKCDNANLWFCMLAMEEPWRYAGLIDSAPTISIDAAVLKRFGVIKRSFAQLSRGTH